MECPDEINYFLPRMVELFTQGQELHHDVEIYFRCIDECAAHFSHWRRKYSAILCIVC